MRVANTCSDCGERIAEGEQVFAANWDEVRSGVGVCAECAEVQADEPDIVDEADVYACDVCEREFGTPQGLAAHSRVHADE